MVIKQVNGMQGLFASQDYKINDLLFKVEGEYLDKPTRTSIQISVSEHVNVKSPLSFINHSCFPNIIIENQYVKVIKTIRSGDQICFNYNDSEYDLSNKFKCVECGQWIKGKLHVNEFPCLKKEEKKNLKEGLLQENY
jgi:SET domain-containing protein